MPARAGDSLRVTLEYRVMQDEPLKNLVAQMEQMDLETKVSLVRPDWAVAVKVSSKPPVPLDKELQQVVREAESRKGFTDKLFQVWLVDGVEVWILIHVEVQSQVDYEFPQRMYRYNYRLFDRYERPVISLAVLGDEQESWRPSAYGYELGGCRVSLEFPIVKLLDYEARWDELEQSKNPFAVLVIYQMNYRINLKIS